VRQANDGRLADLVIICTGALPAFDQALKSVDRGGTIIFFAAPDPGMDVSVPVNDWWRNGIRLMPSYGNNPLDATQAIDLIRTGRLPLRDMITHRLPLDQTPFGFHLVCQAADSLKVIILPHEIP
jgi:L-iditol 2-dehydrogenase